MVMTRTTRIGISCGGIAKSHCCGMAGGIGGGGPALVLEIAVVEALARGRSAVVRRTGKLWRTCFEAIFIVCVVLFICGKLLRQVVLEKRQRVGLVMCCDEDADEWLNG